ncbi:MAG: histone deacetylase family protein [Alphaproteobacteria bacterium]|nr:histone deacetylase family protein [Rhodospirillaceae bacterium]MBT6510063.1 histone deacetylase family protein [Rhodospirillaceae bacterium]MBT7647985.1 histone deacetylase family protein [Rhodospirillaceae bacterium]MDG2480509.1 histone deacetylase family protein [Alphaproteobacteria bacterium]
MTTRFYTHEACLEHDTGTHHPERIDRLRSVIAVLDDDRFAALDRHTPPKVARDRLELVHPAGYVEAVLAAIPESGHSYLDPDTVVSPGSGEAALRASGALVDAVDAVIAGKADNAFCAVRPPGHHAEPDRAMGFCLFNSVAVGAEHARNAHGMARAAVVDFDVHHGNGTQAMFWDEEGLFYASTHQFPFYPGTGAGDETGRHGNIANAPLAPGSGSDAFRQAFDQVVIPALDAFRPEIVFISAGFDAHERDPLAQINLVEEDYAWATDQLMAIAAVHAAGRVVSVLEGGYDLSALVASAATHVTRLMAAGDGDKA